MLGPRCALAPHLGCRCLQMHSATELSLEIAPACCSKPVQRRNNHQSFGFEDSLDCTGQLDLFIQPTAPAPANGTDKVSGGTWTCGIGGRWTQLKACSTVRCRDRGATVLVALLPPALYTR